MSNPIPVSPSSQPTSAPTAIAAPVVPSRRPEAVASVWGEDGARGAIRTGAYQRACNSRFPLSEPERARLVAAVGRIVFVHGSIVGGRATWREQRRGLDGLAELVVLERPGFAVSGVVSDFSRTPPPVGRVDFEEHAVWVAERLEPGDHLIGHSYGGVISLLTAARVGDRVASLTVVEPPATRVALDVPEVAAFARGGEELWANGPRDDPEAFMRAFLSAVGSDFDPPTPLPPQLLQGAHALMHERGPWQADLPLDACRRSSSRARTIRPSSRSPTASSGRRPPSASSCPASATTSRSARTSTRRCSTSWDAPGRLTPQVPDPYTDLTSSTITTI